MTVTHLVSDTTTALPIHHARGRHSVEQREGEPTGGGVWLRRLAGASSGRRRPGESRRRRRPVCPTDTVDEKWGAVSRADGVAPPNPRGKAVGEGERSAGEGGALRTESRLTHTVDEKAKREGEVTSGGRRRE